MPHPNWPQRLASHKGEDSKDVGQGSATSKLTTFGQWSHAIGKTKRHPSGLIHVTVRTGKEWASAFRLFLALTSESSDLRYHISEPTFRPWTSILSLLRLISAGMLREGSALQRQHSLQFS